MDALQASVSIELNGRPGTEIEQEARDKIRAIAESFATATVLTLTEEAAPCIEEEAD